jgi:hypothetical protein
MPPKLVQLAKGTQVVLSHRERLGLTMVGRGRNGKLGCGRLRRGRKRW